MVGILPLWDVQRRDFARYLCWRSSRKSIRTPTSTTSPSKREQHPRPSALPSPRSFSVYDSFSFLAVGYLLVGYWCRQVLLSLGSCKGSFFLLLHRFGLVADNFEAWALASSFTASSSVTSYLPLCAFLFLSEIVLVSWTHRPSLAASSSLSLVCFLLVS